MPCLPVVSYPLSSVIYSPLLATTSAASPADLPVYDARTLRAPEPKAWASEWPPQDGSKARLRDLNRSLRQAMEAARDMKATSHRMSRSLAWELSQAKSLRGSCLF
ncbi:hypothetical protein JRQ81_008465 [Phrynocephalus forsythii]|uniref:Uncharacterized protein n=1 Tax=Phrynocephalus forsythii TaxID=171643 RepID=A0A9Q0XAM1_9SAUR|nr:hypothetical protein JRQ81_008465 [Phrynocephalus forsythii]